MMAVCLTAVLISPWTVYSQHYYVVIGAFAVNENASEFKSYFPGLSTDTSLTVAESNNLLHLYVLKTSDKQTAISRTLQLKSQVESSGDVQASTDFSGVERRLSGSLKNDKVTPVVVETTSGGSTGSAAGSSAIMANAGNVPPRPVGKYFKFRIESPEGNVLPGTVHHVDFEKGRDIGTYRTNTFVDLLRPGDSHEPMAVVCGVFGYKEIEKYIDYANPSLTDKDAYVDESGAWVIPYKLERLEKGDVSVMYNVSFYKDAVIMRKESRADLDELVRMMHSNPYYEITIHAYCNGRNKREITALGPDKNYFDVAGSQTVPGSAKDLTRLRAEAVRSYLVDHGIDESRVDIYAWGGSDRLVKPDSPHAGLNDRIEIEITRD